MGFYNTVPTIDNRQLLMFTKAAETCQALVLEVFKLNPDKDFTPYEMYQQLIKQGRSYPRSSVQRSITDLTIEGILIKTGERRKGEFHVATNAWKLTNKQNEI